MKGFNISKVTVVLRRWKSETMKFGMNEMTTEGLVCRVDKEWNRLNLVSNDLKGQIATVKL